MGHLVGQTEVEAVGVQIQTSSSPQGSQSRLHVDIPDDPLRHGKPAEGAEEEDGDGEWWVSQVMQAFKSINHAYVDTWYNFHTQLMHGDGPLPHTWRLYIATLAVCQHEVQWLVHALLTDFLAAGGDRRWMSGLHHAPAKLSALASVNNLMAHRPWLLSPHHVKQLTKSNDSWSVGELCQALCLMAHFHSLASFLHGCALSVLPEPVLKKVLSKDAKKGKDGNVSPVDPNGANLYMLKICFEQSDCDIKTAVKRPASIEKITKDSADKHSRQHSDLTVEPNFRYLLDGEESSLQFLPIQEYNWQDHGYALCCCLLGDVGTLLDDRFTAALSYMASVSPGCSPPTTAYSPAHAHVVAIVNGKASLLEHKGPPSIQGKAVWRYVQWLLGIHHDDCDYDELDRQLDCKCKEFVKNTCCFPELLDNHNSTKENANAYEPPANRVGTSLVVMEARLQTELLHALRAIMLYQC